MKRNQTAHKKTRRYTDGSARERGRARPGESPRPPGPHLGGCQGGGFEFCRSLERRFSVSPSKEYPSHLPTLTLAALPLRPLRRSSSSTSSSSSSSNCLRNPHRTRSGRPTRPSSPGHASEHNPGHPHRAVFFVAQPKLCFLKEPVVCSKNMSQIVAQYNCAQSVVGYQYSCTPIISTAQ